MFSAIFYTLGFYVSMSLVIGGLVRLVFGPDERHWGMGPWRIGFVIMAVVIPAFAVLLFFGVNFLSVVFNLA